MPERPVIVDTGPLVAFLVAEDAYHDWIVEQFKLLRAPLLTCESVFTEAVFLLSRYYQAIPRLFELIEQQSLVIDFSISNEIRALRSLMAKYRDLPMSLADACLVRMAEIHSKAVVLTLDTHFNIYRRNGRMPIEVISPQE